MTSGNKLSRIIAVFLCAVLAFDVVLFASPRVEVQAAATAKIDIYNDWGDGCNFNIKLSGFTKGAKVTLKLTAPHEIGGYNIWAPNGVSASRVKGTEQAINISFTYNGKNVQRQVT